MDDPRQHEGTVADRRWSAAHAARLGFVLAFVVFLIAAYWLRIDSTNEARQGCERLAGTRTVIHDVLADAIPNLESQADVAENRVRAKLYRDRAAEYQGYVDDLEAQVAGLLKEAPANAMDIDCAKAYPYPPPIGWFYASEPSTRR